MTDFSQDFDLVNYTAPMAMNLEQFSAPMEIDLAQFTAPMEIDFTQFTAPTEIDLAQSAPQLNSSAQFADLSENFDSHPSQSPLT